MSDQNLETLLDEKELSRLLRVSIGTLRFWRTIERGPQYVKIGALVRYRPDDVDAWIAGQHSRCGTLPEVAR